MKSLKFFSAIALSFGLSVAAESDFFSGLHVFAVNIEIEFVGSCE